jgi:crossover junction endodeoxyribonuclease RuvC
VKILALDLSLTSSGYAIGERVGILEPPRNCSAGMPRIDWIMLRCLELALLPEPVDLVAVEGYSFGSQGRQHATGELGGLVRWALWRKRVPVVEIPPKSLKTYAAGNGNANKERMLAEAIRRLGYQGASNDEADALWLRAMALDAYGAPVVTVPQAHRAALQKIKWPNIRKAEAA